MPHIHYHVPPWHPSLSLFHCSLVARPATLACLFVPRRPCPSCQGQHAFVLLLCKFCRPILRPSYIIDINGSDMLATSPATPSCCLRAIITVTVNVH